MYFNWGSQVGLLWAGGAAVPAGNLCHCHCWVLLHSSLVTLGLKVTEKHLDLK